MTNNNTNNKIEAISKTYRKATNMIGEKFDIKVKHSKYPSKDFEQTLDLLYKKNSCLNENQNIDYRLSAETIEFANIDKIWIQHNYKWNNMFFIIIHVKFNVHNLKDADCKCIAYFYYFNETYIYDENKNYGTYDGQVSVGNDFKPGYNPLTFFPNFCLFIPYDELHSAQQSKDIMFKIQLFKENLLLTTSPLQPIYI